MGGLNLPDTIVYEKGQPVTWYFTLDSVMRKKRKDNMSIDAIYQKLTKGVVGFRDADIKQPAGFLFHLLQVQQPQQNCRNHGVQHNLPHQTRPQYSHFTSRKLLGGPLLG